MNTTAHPLAVKRVIYKGYWGGVARVLLGAGADNGLASREIKFVEPFLNLVGPHNRDEG